MNEILKQVIRGKPHVIIGKNGLSSAVITEIANRLKRKPYVKIKFLQLVEFESMHDTAEYLANTLQARVEDVRGKTCVLYRKLTNPS